MIDNKLREAFKFFHAHACHVVGHQASHAMSLARAELWWQSRDDIEWVVESEQESYRDVFGEDPPEGVTFYCVMLKRGREVLASLGFVDDHDGHMRVVRAELLVEARARIEEIDAAKAAAEKLARQKDAALHIVQYLASLYCHPDHKVNGSDLVSEVRGLLEDTDFIVEERLVMLQRLGYRIERSGDRDVSIRSTGGAIDITIDVKHLGQFIKEHVTRSVT